MKHLKVPAMSSSSVRRPAAVCSSQTSCVQCLVLGDGMVGKTCLTVSYLRRSFVDKYTATIYDDYTVPVLYNGEHSLIAVKDTAGQSDFEDLRAYTYKESEVLVLCFSVCDRDSFSSVCNSWIPEMRRHTKRRLPVILVGTQIDMRQGLPEHDVVSREEGELMAKRISAEAYVECSAKSRHGLRDVFERVMESAIKHKKRKHSILRKIFRRSALHSVT